MYTVIFEHLYLYILMYRNDLKKKVVYSVHLYFKNIKGSIRIMIIIIIIFIKKNLKIFRLCSVYFFVTKHFPDNMLKKTLHESVL